MPESEWPPELKKSIENKCGSFCAKVFESELKNEVLFTSEELSAIMPNAPYHYCIACVVREAQRIYSVNPNISLTEAFNNAKFTLYGI